MAEMEISGSLGGHSGMQRLNYLFLGKIHRISLMASLWHPTPVLALLPLGRYELFHIFFRTRSAQRKIWFKGNTIPESKLNAENKPLKSVCWDLTTFQAFDWAKQAAACTRVELIYKQESLDQLSQATFSWRLHLYLHPCLAVLKKRD